jgi:hypothetical protein
MKGTFYLLLVLLAAHSVMAYTAVNASLEFNKDILKPGDQFTANLVLKNNLNLQHTVIIESILENEDRTYTNLLPPMYVELNVNEEKRVTLYDLSIDDSFDGGVYLLSAGIVLQDNTLITASEEFAITGTPEDFSLDLDLCKDSSCTERSKVIILGEDIYLGYSSEVENPTVTANLTHPDGTIEEITLPVSIKAEKVGTYLLEVTASREGYRTQVLSTQFGVIEKPASINGANTVTTTTELQSTETTTPKTQNTESTNPEPRNTETTTNEPRNTETTTTEPDTSFYFGLGAGIVVTTAFFLVLNLFKKRF